MLKSLLILGMIASSNSSYVGVEKIQAYQSNDTIKELSFDFVGSYNYLHDINVKISVYDDNVYQGTYSNNLEFIGNKTATTRIDFHLKKDFYVLIDIYSSTELIIENVKLNFYIQNDCYLDIDNKVCKRIYKSEYVNGVSKDVYLNVNVNDTVFNKFLSTNKLNFTDLKFSSEYLFEKSKIVFLLKEKIEGYDIHYHDGYIFPLAIEKESYNYFVPLQDYYVDILDFKYSEYYFEQGEKTSSIHFPFSNGYKEYECYILIEDFINLELKFIVGVSDNLIGECDSSKFCLVRNKL